jgi:hypothetical protein
MTDHRHLIFVRHSEQWLGIIAVDAFNIEHVLSSREIIGSNQEFYASAKRQTRRLASLVVASDHRVDTSRIQSGFRQIRIDNAWIRPNNHQFPIINVGASRGMASWRIHR